MQDTEVERKLVVLVERDQEQVVYFTTQLIPIQEHPTAPIQVSVGLDAKGPYLRRAKTANNQIIFVNRVGKGAELRITHLFFNAEEKFYLEGLTTQYGYSLHTLNKPSAFIDFVDLVDNDNPENVALGLECCK